MRNASVVGQAMPALEFPAAPNQWVGKLDWSAMYPDYKERMKAMSLYVCLLMREWLD